MKNIIFKIATLVIVLSIRAQSDSTNCRFVLNDYHEYHENIYVEGSFSYNNIKNIFMLTWYSDYFDPAIQAKSYFYTYSLKIAITRFEIEVGQYVKSYPAGGIYNLGWYPDGGGMIVGYDESKVSYQKYDDMFANVKYLWFQSKYFNFSTSVQISPSLDPGIPISFILSKSFKKFAYSVGVVCPTYYFIPFPCVYFASISYSPVEKINLYCEGKNMFRTFNNNHYAAGYIALFGASYNIFKYTDVSVFYHYFYDNRKHPIPFARVDRRLLFQIIFYLNN